MYIPIVLFATRLALTGARSFGTIVVVTGLQSHTLAMCSTNTCYGDCAMYKSNGVCKKS